MAMSVFPRSLAYKKQTSVVTDNEGVGNPSVQPAPETPNQMANAARSNITETLGIILRFTATEQRLSQDKGHHTRVQGLCGMLTRVFSTQFIEHLPVCESLL